MATSNQVREVHKLLDVWVRNKGLYADEVQMVRSLLPELPKQKTLAELIAHVDDAWAAASGYEWGGNSYDPFVSIEDWLDELRGQLEGLTEESAKPAHPEFLETEGSYYAAPEGTVVATPGRLPWVKEGGRIWSCSGGTNSDSAMAKSGQREVLRWGWGE